MSKPSLSAQLDRDFDRLFGDTWQPTMPDKPAPMPVPVMPVPEFPPKGGHEL